VTVWGTGTARREFMHTDDLAAACLFLLEHYSEKQFLNAGSGTDISIRELAELLAHIIGYKGSLVFDTSKPDGMPQKLLDVSKINSLGWNAQIALEDGLRGLYTWFLEHEAATP
jgi:GDP-L-fucose synthase